MKKFDQNTLANAQTVVIPKAWVETEGENTDTGDLSETQKQQNWQQNIAAEPRQARKARKQAKKARQQQRQEEKEWQQRQKEAEHVNEANEEEASDSDDQTARETESVNEEEQDLNQSNEKEVQVEDSCQDSLSKDQTSWASLVLLGL